MKQIPLTHGKVALVDDSDFDRVSAHEWFAWHKRGIWYARAQRRKEGVDYMHRFILENPSSMIDHRDGDGLNNQRRNLRPATQLQNSGNSRKPKSGVTSKYKGVHWETWTGRWKASISRGAKGTTNLGRFNSEKLAARAYDAAAREKFGEFARLNFPE